MSALLTLGLAFWLGVLTSISPCAMVANVAAMSFISRSLGQGRRVLASGLLYAAGQATAYVGLGVLVLLVLGRGAAGSGAVARFLQQYMPQFVGPVLIVIGMFLTGLLSVSASLTLVGPRLQQRVAGGGRGWAFVLGLLLAMSFCPISAALFFGSLLSLYRPEAAGAATLAIALPGAFALGTALPVLAFAAVLSFAAAGVAKAYARLQQIDRYARAITGAALILVGVYYCLTYVFELHF